MDFITSHERAQLAKIIGVEDEDLDEALAPFHHAAREEYVRMILGQRVFTRGQDIREYRLFLVVKHVYLTRLPSEEDVSSLFQLTIQQSRGLLRAMLSKYQYEVADILRSTLESAIASAVPVTGEPNLRITCPSETVIDSLNREIARIDGSLTQISRRRGSIGTYEITPSTHRALTDALGTRI